MPNWVYNSVKIQGPTSELKRFISTAHGDNQALSFSKILPPPDGIYEREAAPLFESETPALPQLPDWYEWCCTNWGTKWDVDGTGQDVKVKITPSSVDFNFETAWAPALPFFHVVAEKFPALRLDYIYSDESMDFAGRTVWKEGSPIMSKEFTSADKEYDCISRGCRLEDDNVWDVCWDSDIPTQLGLEAISKKDSPKGYHHPLPIPHPQPAPLDPIQRALNIKNIHQKIDNTLRLQKTLENEIVRISSELGFDFDAWAKSGLDVKNGDLWSAPQKASDGQFASDASLYSISRIQMRMIRERIEKQAPQDADTHPEVRLVLRGKSPRGCAPGKVDLSHGSIRLFQCGVELITPRGWGVQGLIKDGEQAYIVIRNASQFQNPMSGDACCSEWSMSEGLPEPVKTAEAFCVDGKLWNPTRRQPALTVWLENGEKKLEASFFNNKHVNPKENSSAVSLRSPTLYKNQPPTRDLQSSLRTV